MDWPYNIYTAIEPYCFCVQVFIDQVYSFSLTQHNQNAGLLVSTYWSEIMVITKLFCCWGGPIHIDHSQLLLLYFVHSLHQLKGATAPFEIIWKPSKWLPPILPIGLWKPKHQHCLVLTMTCMSTQDGPVVLNNKSWPSIYWLQLIPPSWQCFRTITQVGNNSGVFIKVYIYMYIKKWSCQYTMVTWCKQGIIVVHVARILFLHTKWLQLLAHNVSAHAWEPS